MGVHHHAEDDVHGLRQAEGEVPLGQVVDLDRVNKKKILEIIEIVEIIDVLLYLIPSILIVIVIVTRSDGTVIVIV